MTFWLSAFIPGNIEDLTFRVPGGRHAGKTAIPGPFPGSDCFLTDQRGFRKVDPMQLPEPPARMSSHIVMSVQGKQSSIINQQHKCGKSIEVKCEDGKEDCAKAAIVKGRKFHRFGAAGGIVFVNLEAFANNGCFAGSPDIDVIGSLIIRPSEDGESARVQFIGMVEPFPAFEAYAVFNGGTPTTVFRVRPLPGTDPWNLVGPPTRPINKTVQVPCGSP